MFVWAAIFSLAGASAVFGFPGPIPRDSDSKTPEAHVNASKTIDVSGIKTRIKLILEQTLDIEDKRAISNSTSLNVKVEKRDAKCASADSQCCSDGKCDCSGGKCVCSGGQCSCSTGCQSKKSDETRSTTQEPAVSMVKREAEQQVNSTEEDSFDDDDDEDEEESDPTTKTYESSADAIMAGYEVMLQRERQLYSRSASQPDDKEVPGHNIVERQAPELDEWRHAVLNEAMGWMDAKPAFKDWDFLYPNMNQARLARELAKDEEQEPEGVTAIPKGSKERNETVKKNEDGVRSSKVSKRSVEQEPEGVTAIPKESKERNETVEKNEDGVRSSKNPKRSVDSAETSGQVSRSSYEAKTIEVRFSGSNKESAGASTKPAPNSGNVSGKDDSKSVTASVEDTSSAKHDYKSKLKENFRKVNEKRRGKPRSPSNKGNVNPNQEKAPAKEEDPKDEAQGAPSMPELTGDKAKRYQEKGLEASWGSGAVDSVNWQQERRLGDNPNEPDFNNLDIRYLGGNDLNIPPSDIDDKVVQPSSNVERIRSASSRNIAAAVLTTSFALATLKI